MNIKQWFCALIVALSVVFSSSAMEPIKFVSSFTCTATGAGLIVNAIKNNNTFMDRTRFIEENPDPLKTLYIAEWFTEVLAPLSGGTVLMLAGFLLAYY